MGFEAGVNLSEDSSVFRKLSKCLLFLIVPALPAYSWKHKCWNAVWGVTAVGGVVLNKNLGFFKSKSSQVVCLILQAPGWDELENCSLLHLTSLPWHPSIMLCIYLLHFTLRIWMSPIMLFSSTSLWAQTPETPCCKHHFTEHISVMDKSMSRESLFSLSW